MEKITYADYAYAAQIKINAARRPGGIKLDVDASTGILTLIGLEDAPEPKRRKIALSESAPLFVDTGAQRGDPAGASKRRLAEIDGAFERGTVKAPVKGDKGRTKLTDVPATEENVTLALVYWEGRKPRTEESRAKQAEMVATLKRQLTVLREAYTLRYREGAKEFVKVPSRATAEAKLSAPRAGAAVGQRDHGRSDGVALVRGKTMNATTERPTKGWAAVAGTMHGPVGHEQMDAELRDPRDKGRRTKAQRRNWRAKQRRVAVRAERDALKAASVAALSPLARAFQGRA